MRVRVCVCVYIPWRSRKTRTCPGYGKVETRGPGWVHLGTWAPPKVVCGRFVTYIYCYKRPHVWNMHPGAALCSVPAPAKLPEIPRLLVLEFRAVVPRVPRAYSALFRGDGNSAFGRSGCADHARNSRIYCADREIAQLLIVGHEYKMCGGYYLSTHSSKVR